MFVKICGITTPDARDAALEAGADALGFVFAESPRRITPRAAAALARSIPPGTVKVAVLRGVTHAECDALFDAFVPDWLQADADDLARVTLPAACRALPVYREGRAHGLALPPRILFEGARSGSGTAADWHEAKRLAARTELILAGGLDVANVATAIAWVRPFGVDVSSGVESRRGNKDPQRILEFVSRVRELEQTT